MLQSARSPPLPASLQTAAQTALHLGLLQSRNRLSIHCHSVTIVSVSSGGWKHAFHSFRIKDHRVWPRSQVRNISYNLSPPQLHHFEHASHAP